MNPENGRAEDMVQVSKSEYESLKRRVIDLKLENIWLRSLIESSEKVEREREEERKAKLDMGWSIYSTHVRIASSTLKEIGEEFSEREKLPKSVSVTDKSASKLLKRRNERIAQLFDLIDKIEGETLVFLSEAEKILGETWGFNRVKVDGLLTRVKGDELVDLYLACIGLVTQVRSIRRMLRGIIQEYHEEYKKASERESEQ